MANAGKVIGKGVTIELEGNVYRVDDFQHVKPGKGAAFIRTRLKNITMTVIYTTSWIQRHMIRSL